MMQIAKNSIKTPKRNKLDQIHSKTTKPLAPLTNANTWAGTASQVRD